MTQKQSLDLQACRIVAVEVLEMLAGLHHCAFINFSPPGSSFTQLHFLKGTVQPISLFESVPSLYLSGLVCFEMVGGGGGFVGETAQ